VEKNNKNRRAEREAIWIKTILLRQEANYLFFEGGLPKTRIADRLHVSRGFVARWTESPGQDLTEDLRGWPKGKRRKWNVSTEERIERIHRSLKEDPGEFYWGATAVCREWTMRYPHEPPPPLRTVGRIMAEMGLSEPRKKGRGKGAARYLCYPEHTIYHLLGGRVLESDFLQRKLAGRADPLHFLGFSFKKAPRIRYFTHIPGHTSPHFISATDAFFRRFETSDFMKLDNAAATIGSMSGKRSISQAVAFLLSREVTPIFTVPRKPFSQASIEGNNSVFSRFFWKRRQFEDVEDMLFQLELFNAASMRYLGYQPPEKKRKAKKDFCPKIFFTRQVREDEESGEGSIDVLNEKVVLPSPYIPLFVLAEWNLKEEMLYIRFEKDERSLIIEQTKFLINPKSKEKYGKLLLG